MLNKAYFNTKIQVEKLIQGKIIAIITEYTIFKLDLATDRVIFNCLKDEYTFEIFFKELKDELNLKNQDFHDSFLESLIAYCAVVSEPETRMPYPVCEFEDFDTLLDWYLNWQCYTEPERLDFLKNL